MQTSTSTAPPEAARLDRLFRLSLYLFIGTMVFSLAGSLLTRPVPESLALFGPYYPTLVKTPTWTYMALLPILPILMYGPSLGWRRMLLFFAWGTLLGGASELVGTTTGFPFGAYAYTTWLGPKLFGHVPYFIPPSWFAMSIVSYDLAVRVTKQRVGQVLLAAVFMVLWDVSLDPAMSRAFPFWEYPGGGFFFGMPASNWVGWFAVSLVIMAGYAYLGGGLPTTHRWAPWVYALNCAFPLFISLVYGLESAFFIGLAATAVPLLILWKKGLLPSRSDLFGT